MANRSDVKALTDLHLRCFGPGDHVGMIFGDRFIKSMYRWQVSSPSCFVYVALEDNRFAGLVGLCKGSYTIRMLTACWRSLLLSLLSKPWLLFDKQLLKRLIRKPLQREQEKDGSVHPSNYFELSFIGVDDDFRGYGIASQLLVAAKVECKERGGESIVAGVYKWNQPSRSAFLKAGWTELKSLETQDTVSYLTLIE